MARVRDVKSRLDERSVEIHRQRIGIVSTGTSEASLTARTEAMNV